MARRARADTTRRTPALVAVAVAMGSVVAAGLAVDGRDGEVASATAGPSPAALSEVAPGADSLGSTWYCAGGTAVPNGQADHVVNIANFGDDDADVVLTAVPGALTGQVPAAEPVTDELTVPARSRVAVHLADLVQAPFAAAIVEVGPGEVAVEHEISDGVDFGVAPCATSSSSSWYLAAGVTTRDAVEHIVLFNPFPDDAVVDVTFATPDGLRSPPEFSGLIVPSRRVVAVDVGAVVSRYPNVSTSIVARSGRLVVDRVQHFDGTDGPAGLALTPAAPLPASVWYLPDGLVDQGRSEVVTVYNPTERSAEVDVEVDLDASSDPAQPVAADPFALEIAPHGFAQVDIAADGRVPAQRGHAITVRGQNGVPVVVERWIRAGPPSFRSGLAATLASPVEATRWLSASGGATPAETEVLVVMNPSPEGIARVSVTAVTVAQDIELADLADVEVPPQGRVSIDLGAYVDQPELLLVVESSLPVVAERGLYATAGGFARSILVPSGPTATVPTVDTGSITVG